MNKTKDSHLHVSLVIKAITYMNKHNFDDCLNISNFNDFFYAKKLIILLIKMEIIE